MKKAFGILITALMLIGMISLPLRMPAANAASQTSINNAIAKGLAYLNSTQDPDGSWNESFGYGAANTAMAILAFENDGHYGWNASDPYHTTVQNGLNWLISEGNNVSLSDWTTYCAGSPYVGGASQGASWDAFPYACYETPIVLLAIIGSNAPTNVTSPGPLGVLTYKALAEEIVSWIAWAQNSNATLLQSQGEGQYEGGWRYNPQEGDSDNSVSGWPVLGLTAAELWGINAPSWVKTELAKWTNTDQDMTGNATTNSLFGSFGYTGRDQIYGGIPETAAGIAELTYCGHNTTYANITAAEGYLYSDWNYYDGGWQVNVGSLYSMYGVMKAMRDTTPTPTKFITNYNGTANYEWYNGTGQYADALIANQNASGMWINWVPWPESDEYATSLTTAMGVLILEGGTGAAVVVKYTLTATVLDENTLNPIDGATVAIVGPQTLSGTTNASGITQFVNIQAGDYTVTTSMAGYITNTTSITLTSNYALTIKLQPLAQADFSMSASPTTLTIAQGHSGASTINVTSLNGFNAAVGLVVSGMPAEVNATLSPTSVTPASEGWATSTLSVNVGASATAGTYELTVNGTSGALTHVVEVELIVSAAADFSITASPTSLTIVQGGSGFSTINVTSLNGFNAAVGLAVSGMPSEVNATLSPTSITPASGGWATSTLSVNVGASAVPGTYELTVNGTSEALTHTVEIELIIQAAPDFSITASPTSLKIVQGSSGTSTINVTSLNGFDAAVGLTASGAPTGVTLSLVPTSVTPTSGGFATSILTVVANATALLGSYTLTVTGASGSLTHNATISLIITSSKAIKACVKFEPEKLNLKSEGQWVNCTIRLPRGYNASDINATTILLNGTIPAVNAELIWNCRHTRVLGLLVSFNRTDVEQFILESTHLTKGCMTVDLTITGALNNGTQFQGIGKIKAIVPFIKASVTFEPEKLNLKSEGQWINCTIELPRGYNASDINATTILLNGTIPAVNAELIWNCRHTRVVGLLVSFNRTQVEQFILESTQLTKGCTTVKLTVTGALNNGTQFQGTGQVTVTMHHHHHHHHHCGEDNDHHHKGDDKHHDHH